MKKISQLLLVLGLFFHNGSVFSQEGINEPGRILQSLMNEQANYYDVINYANNYFETNPSLMTEEDGIYTEYKRWRLFWSKRISNIGDEAGDIKFINNSYARYILGNQSTLPANYTLQPVCTTASGFVANWVPLGPITLPEQWLGKVQSILVDESDMTHNTVYIGAPNGGVFKTTDFLTTSLTGPSWICMTENTGLPGLWINSMALDPVTQDLYLATGSDGEGYDIGVIGLHQNGNYFTTAITFDPNINIPIIRKIIMDPNDHQRMFALSSDIIYSTSDGWNTFSSTTPPPSGTGFHFWEIAFDPANSDYVLATGNKIVSNPFSKNGLLMTCDINGTWTDISSSLPTPVTDNIMMDVSMDGSNKVFYIVYHESGNLEHMYKSANHGTATTWTFVHDIAPKLIMYSSDAHLVINHIDPNILYAEKAQCNGAPDPCLPDIGRKVLLSEDGGQSFVTVSSYNNITNGIRTHGDIRCYKLIPGASTGHDFLFVGTDGGIMYSEINSSTNFTWQNRNGIGLNITQFYALSGAKLNHSNFFVAGAQDNGGYVYDNGSWNRTSTGGDEYEGGVENTNDENLYLTVSSGGLPVSLVKNLGNTVWSNINTSLTSSYLTFFIDHLHSNTIFRSYQDIFTSTDHGNNWTPISNFGGQVNDYNKCRNITTVAVDPNNPQHILLCFEGATGNADLNSCTNLCLTTQNCPTCSSGWCPLTHKFYVTTNGGYKLA